LLFGFAEHDDDVYCEFGPFSTAIRLMVWTKVMFVTKVEEKSFMTEQHKMGKQKRCDVAIVRLGG